eukprot:scaffold46988_cov91-Cyclotella_meneghiniana.AAC.3
MRIIIPRKSATASGRGHTMIILVPAKVNDDIAVRDGTLAEPAVINSDNKSVVDKEIVFKYPVTGAEGESPEDLGFIPRSPPFERPMVESRAMISVNKRDMKGLGREQLLTDNVIDMFVPWSNHLQQSPYLDEKNHNFKNYNYYVFSIQHTTKLR